MSNKTPLRKSTEEFLFYRKEKSTALPCFLVCALSVGASAPNPDTRNFSRKVSWNFKSFAKNKWEKSAGKF